MQKQNWSTLLSRAGLFFLIWWILSDGALSSWWFGLPIVILASVSSVVLLPPQPFSWFEFLRFIPFFLVRSLLGGVDVAWRAFHPSLPISPQFYDYTTKLPSGLAQVFMANTISLLPGTLSAELDGGVIRVHILDSRSDYLTELEAIELRVARVFGRPSNAVEGDA